MQADEHVEHSVDDHLEGWSPGGPRSDHVYVRATNKTMYVGMSLAKDNSRAMAFRSAEAAATVEENLGDVFDAEFADSVRQWPLMYRISLPTPCREDLAVAEALLIRAMHMLAEERKLNFLNGTNNWGEPGLPIPDGRDIWIDDANGALRAFTSAEKIDVECTGPYRFCHSANRDAVLDALRLNLDEIQPYFPQGHLRGFGAITLKELAAALGAKQLVVVKVAFRDLENRTSLRGSEIDLRERACRYWSHQDVTYRPQLSLPSGSDTDAPPQYLIATAKFPDLLEKGSVSTIVGVWRIHCYDDHGLDRSFGLTIDDETPPTLLGRWLDKSGKDAVTDLCVKHIKTENHGPFYWPQSDDCHSDSH